MSEPTLTLAAIEAAQASVAAQRAALGDAATDVALAALAAQRDALLSGEVATPQLRQVSILFLDVVGSTSLSQHLDPEQINEVMDGALATFTDIVQAAQGRVLQYAGDSVLAVFGAPIAREDDAQRAVRAGLALLAAGRRQGEAVFERFGHVGFGVRVGIHTGSVLLGAGVDGEHSVRGIAVNVAARMEQTAPAGALRISQATWRLVRGLFEAVAQPPLEVKGVAAPMVTYLVQGESRQGAHHALRGVDGVTSPMVGREAELVRLDAVRETVQSQGLTMITLVAEAGLGKSRLAAEWRSRLPPQVWIEAHASEQAASRPYGLLRQWLTAELDVLDSDAPTAACAKWLEAQRGTLADEGDAAVLGHLIGLDFAAHPEVAPLLTAPRQLRDRAFFHAAQWLTARAGAAAQPLVLLLDDAHWADEGSLAFIAHLGIAHPRLPLLVWVLTRPGFFESNAGWGAAMPQHQRWDLPALDATRLHSLAAALLARAPDAPPALLDRLVEQADGNPFYLEELVNVLVDRGVLASDGDRWRFEAERMQALPLPGTLVGVLQARLDALPETALRTARLAAVVGHHFWDSTLASLGAPLPDGLQLLIEREVAVALDDSRIAQAQEHRFRHHLSHQVSYESILKRARRELHAKVAHWLAAQPGEPPLELIAEHFERGEEPALALDHWQRAAFAAAQRYANGPALAHVARALALTPADDLPRRHALQLLRCKVLEVLSEHDRLPAELDTLMSLAVQIGDADRQSEALRRMARNRYDSGRLTEALTLAQRAVDCAPSSNPARQAHGRALLMQCRMRLGQRVEGEQEAQRALALARTAGDRATQAMLLNDLGMAADEQGDHESAIGHYEQAIALHRSLGNRVNEGGSLANLAYARMMLGDRAGAAASFEEALALFVRIGQRQNEGITLINVGIARLRLGDAASALRHAAQAIDVLAATRDRWAEAAAWRVRGQAALALGQHTQARPWLEQAESMFEAMALPEPAAEARAALVEWALAAGEPALATEWAQELARRWDHGLALEGAEEPLRMQWLVWRALHAAGDPLAAPVLARATAMLQRRAQRIAQPGMRDKYLDAVAEHRALMAAGNASTGS